MMKTMKPKMPEKMSKPMKEMDDEMSSEEMDMGGEQMMMMMPMPPALKGLYALVKSTKG